MSTEAEIEAIMEWADVTHLQALDALAAVEPLIRERLAQEVAVPETLEQAAHRVAKTLWDRAEADYWDSERDWRPFDPSVTERDADDADRGRDLLEEVTETLALAGWPAVRSLDDEQGVWRRVSTEIAEHFRSVESNVSETYVALVMNQVFKRRHLLVSDATHAPATARIVRGATS